MGSLLVAFLQLASLLFVARAVLSWFPIGRDSPAYPVRRFIESVTEPILVPVRRILPQMGKLDLSVLAVIVFISFVLTPIAASL